MTRASRTPWQFYFGFFGGVVLLSVWTLAMVVVIFDPCASVVVATALEPNGGNKAVIRGLNCGATEANATGVAIMPRAVSPSGHWPVEILLKNGDYGPAGGPAVHARWLARGKLLLLYERGATVLDSVCQMPGVTVTYRPADIKELRALGAAVPAEGLP